MPKLDDSTWSMKYQLKADKFLQIGVLCPNRLSKLELKVEIYGNMVQVVQAARNHRWSICYVSLIRDFERLHNIHNIEFEH